MSIKMLATDAFLRVEALEELLVAKGLIQTGEVEAHKQALMEEKSRRHTEALRKFWESMEDGDIVDYGAAGSSYGWRGELIAKSAIPFQALTVRMLGKTRFLHPQKEIDFTLTSFWPSDITVWHKGTKGTGFSVKPPEWGDV